MHWHDVHGLRHDLIVMFLGLETWRSASTFSWASSREKRSNEAALKYLLLGGFSTGILAYGFSLLYPFRQHSIWDIGTTLDRRSICRWPRHWPTGSSSSPLSPLLLASSLRSQPSHSISGHPTSMRARLHPSPLTVSVASKTAGFALLVRLFVWSSLAPNPSGHGLVAWRRHRLAHLGQCLRPLRRPTSSASSAYSSILTSATFFSLVAGNETGLTGIFLLPDRLRVHATGAFVCCCRAPQRGLIGDETRRSYGLYHRSPAAALLLLIFMLSLAGIPPTAGFMGKYFIFLALIESHHPCSPIFAALYIVPRSTLFPRGRHAWLKKPGDAPAPLMSSAQPSSSARRCL